MRIESECAGRARQDKNGGNPRSQIHRSAFSIALGKPSPAALAHTYMLLAIAWRADAEKGLFLIFTASV